MLPWDGPSCRGGAKCVAVPFSALRDRLEPGLLGDLSAGTPCADQTVSVYTRAGNLDQPSAIGARLAFAQRVMHATAVVPTALLTAGKSLCGNFFARRLGRRIGHFTTQANQQVVRRRV